MVKILLVDDFENWRRKVRQMLQGRTDLQVIGEASDGLEAVQKAVELKPDLILLDIGLPKLNGIQAARQIRELVPDSKILVMSQETDASVAQELFKLGVLGYVVKLHAGKELEAAVEAVLQGKKFVSGGLQDRDHSRMAEEGDVPFHFEFDPESKIFHAKFRGRVTDGSLRYFYQFVASRVDGIDFRACIADFSGATSFHLNMDAIRELAALAPADPLVSRPRVIVAPNTLIYSFARMFQIFGKITRPNLHVVRNFAQALALLGVATPHFEPFDPGVPI